MEQIKQYTINLLTEIIIQYIKESGSMEFYVGYVNSKGNYVTLHERTDTTGIDYSIRRTMLSSDYIETEIDGGEIIFQFEEDVSYIDDEEKEMYLSDYKDICNDKDKYIKDKVDYIISLTW